MHLLPLICFALLPFASALPTLSSRRSNPPFFVLTGDSTTSPSGGWGDAFLSLFSNGAGVNIAHHGQTTRSFVAGGYWKLALDYVRNHSLTNDVYVTIQFGHNDQKPGSGVSVTQYQANLENLANEARKAGATPILVTPLTRRAFTDTHPATLITNLETQRQLTIQAAKNTNTKYIDLNLASTDYVEAIGYKDAQKYNFAARDSSHLNDLGGLVFGTMAAELMVGSGGPLESLSADFALDATVLSDIQSGVYYGGKTKATGRHG